MSVTFQSCLKDQEDVFEDSAAARLTKTLQEAQKVLVGAEYGWRMYYYPDPDQSYGGYVYTIKFTNDKATVWSELFDNPSESLYKMTRDDGPVLSFDTHNSNIQFFATPSSTLYQAYKGDFEFVIYKATAAEVVLKGKRTRNVIKMYPLSADEDPAAVVKSVGDNAGSVYVSQFVGNIGGVNTLVYLDLDYRWVSFYNVVEGEDGNKAGDLITESPYAYTENGMLLYNEVTVGTEKISSIEWLVDSGSINIGGNAIKGELPAGWHTYDAFLGNWTLKYSGGTMKLTIEQDVNGKSYIIKGLSAQFDVKANYSLASGAISLCTQTVGNNGTYDVKFTSWDSKAGYVNYSESIGMIGKFISTEDNTTVTWGDNGVWGTYKVNSMILYFFNGSTRVGASSAPWVFVNDTNQAKAWEKMTRE